MASRFPPLCQHSHVPGSTMSESGFPYQDITPPATHLGLTYPRPRLPHQNTHGDHFKFGEPKVHSSSNNITMASPSASLISALDKIPTVSPTNASSPKLAPLILSEIKEPGTGLGVISLHMFDASRWYSSLPPFSFHFSSLSRSVEWTSNEKTRTYFARISRSPATPHLDIQYLKFVTQITNRIRAGESNVKEVEEFVKLLTTDGEDAFWAPVSELVPEVDPDEFVTLLSLPFFFPFPLPCLIRPLAIYLEQTTLFFTLFVLEFLSTKGSP